MVLQPFLFYTGIYLLVGANFDYSSLIPVTWYSDLNLEIHGSSPTLNGGYVLFLTSIGISTSSHHSLRKMGRKHLIFFAYELITHGSSLASLATRPFHRAGVPSSNFFFDNPTLNSIWLP